jgi:hypothetical protein
MNIANPAHLFGHFLKNLFSTVADAYHQGATRSINVLLSVLIVEIDSIPMGNEGIIPGQFPVKDMTFRISVFHTKTLNGQ